MTPMTDTKLKPMSDDEIRDVLTCAKECPESPFNVGRVEELMNEALRLRSSIRFALEMIGDDTAVAETLEEALGDE